MLRELFTEFDNLCLSYGLYKLYTIGDCYVAMAFTDSNKRNPVEEAKNIVMFGLDMVKIIKKCQEAVDYQELEMRIGIHTG